MLKTFCHLHDEEGIFRFYVGGALGVDMWAAEQLLYLKEQPGYQDTGRVMDSKPIELSTYSGYEQQLTNPIAPYFREHPVDL